MKIIFGPEHDSVHIDPMQPGAYEWWYFDALSDDGKYALVVIFFLGSPMTPYYKAVVDGKNPLPRDWCGVFVTLHELEQNQWTERAYAYNLYRYRENQSGWFHNDPLRIGIGGSELQGIYPPDSSGFPQRWQIALDEPGLWGGRTKATLDFTMVGPPLAHEPLGTDTDPHTWVCVAPVCSVSGEITQADGTKVPFSGRGYHDHNFGQLPWDDVEVWYWGHAAIIESKRARTRDKEKRVPTKHLTYYVVTPMDSKADQIFVLMLDKEGQIEWLVDDGAFEAIFPTGLSGKNVINPRLPIIPAENLYGLPLPLNWTLQMAEKRLEVRGAFPFRRISLSEGPFYSRLVSTIVLWLGNKPIGIAADDKKVLSLSEVFRPSRLCHPLWSRLMWTRIRRRS